MVLLLILKNRKKRNKNDQRNIERNSKLNGSIKAIKLTLKLNEIKKDDGRRVPKENGINTKEKKLRGNLMMVV